MTGRSPSADGRARRGLLRRAVAVVVVVLSGLGLSGCWLFPAEWNEKLTVTVSTPHGDVSGSSVRWQKLSEDPVLHSAHPRLGGEAVVVEVGKGRYLFALLQQYRPQTEILFFPDEAPLKSAYKLKDRKGEVLEVPRGMYPLLVTFGNLNEPRSVEQVDPANLAATFGPGYALKSITLEITDEPVTQGEVEKVIPWISTYRGNLRPPSLRLGPGSHNAADVLPVENLGRFDTNGDVFAERSAWLSGDDGFLVLDRNGNGRIDDLSEMFGPQTGRGFQDLAVLDSNRDGAITAADLDFARIGVWQDRDQDGLTGAGELRTLGQHGIIRIDLAGAKPLDIVTPQGIELLAESTFTRADGTQGAILEAIFAASPIDTRFKGEKGAAPWLAHEGIDARGYGRAEARVFC